MNVSIICIWILVTGIILQVSFTTFRIISPTTVRLFLNCHAMLITV